MGGWELRQPIFVSDVKADSQPAAQGLKVGDQVMANISVYFVTVVHLFVRSCQSMIQNVIKRNYVK